MIVSSRAARHGFRRRLRADPRLHLGHAPSERLAFGAGTEEAGRQAAGVSGKPELLLVLVPARGNAVLRIEGIVAADVVEEGHDSLGVAAFHGWD